MNVFAHYSKMIDELIEKYDFCKFYFQFPFSLCYSLREDDMNVSLNCGATRGCLIDDNYDWVVKFDCVANDNDFDNCMREIDLYNIARAEGLDEFFAKPIYLGEYRRKIKFYDGAELYWGLPYSGDCIESFDDSDFLDYLDNFIDETLREVEIVLPLYAYPKAKQYKYPAVSDYAIKSVKRSPLTDRNQIVGYVFEEKYDADKVEQLIDFLINNKINDLHCGNVMDLNGLPVLVDYCGFHKEGDY